NQTTIPLDSSLLLFSPSTHDNSPLLDPLLNPTIKRKYENKHSYINEKNNTTSISKRFHNSAHDNENVIDDNIVIDNYILT
ncbi:unnamed protein product, partial [Rotaria sp. Silwood1]